MMNIHVIDTLSVVPQAWKNGGGVTREMLAWPLGSGDQWSVRISVATIDRDGPFSSFTDTQRWMAVLDGSGVSLRFGMHCQTLMHGDAPLAFHGEDAPGCSLVSGSTRDLNLMSRGGVSTMQRVQGDDTFAAEAGFLAFYGMTPGVWSDGNGNTRSLPAHALLWIDAVEPGMNWRFMADEDAEPAPVVHGYWMHYARHDAQKGCP